MILCDNQIKKMVEEYGMITPFEENQISSGVISYGLSSFGYDARVDRQFKIFTNLQSSIIDPKNFDPRSLVEIEEDYCIIPPNSFVLAKTIEKFRMPPDVIAICLGKSTYARCGIIVNVTPLEPCWRGNVTLEFSNTTPLPAKIYAGEGACQFLFFKGNLPRVNYESRNGKYQDQEEITLPKVKEPWE